MPNSGRKVRNEMAKHERLQELMKGRPALDQVLFESIDHLLFMAFVLVGKVGMRPEEVLSLTWPAVDLVDGQLLLEEGVLRLDEPLVEMLFRTATRRREDRRRSSSWRASEWLFVDENGYRYIRADADTSLVRFCQRVGVTPVPLAELASLDLH